MNTIDWLTQTKRTSQFLLISGMLLLVSSCSDESLDRSARPEHAGKKAKNSELNSISSNSNSSSSAGDYTISLSIDGKIWTYVITKNGNAKDLSHFIINLQNCAERSATIENIVSATVNGAPATLENSEGNTGCNVSSVTSNFVKFDDLPEADSYTIVFELDHKFGNFVGTTGWLKAGTSCVAYPILAPCCPQ